MTDTQIRKTIIANRLRLGLSQSALGRATGIGQAQVCNYEAGRLDFGLRRIAKLCEALGLEVMIRAK